jgi:hypothetical protein
MLYEQIHYIRQRRRLTISKYEKCSSNEAIVCRNKHQISKNRIRRIDRTMRNRIPVRQDTRF